jgi:hypothetical protein
VGEQRTAGISSNSLVTTELDGRGDSDSDGDDDIGADSTPGHDEVKPVSRQLSDPFNK